MAELDIDIVRDFIITRGGKVKNNDLVSHFKSYLNDPRYKETNRAKFKSIVNTLAIVKLDTSGEKMLVLKKKYRDDAPLEPTPRKETPLKYAAPKAKIKEAFVPRTPSVGDNAAAGASADGGLASGGDATGNDSLLSEIQKELSAAGLKDETDTDPVSREGEVFEHAVSQQPSPTPQPALPHQEPEETQDDASFHDAASVQSEKDTDQTDAKNTVSPMFEDTPPPQEHVAEHSAETYESKAPIAEPFQSYQNNNNKEESSQDTLKETPKEDNKDATTKVAEITEQKKPSDKIPADDTNASSREVSSEKEDTSLTTPARVPSSESLGPKEPPISVKDRAKFLNKVTSQADLQGVQQGPEKLLRRSEAREGSEDSDCLQISLNQTEREWMIHSAKSNYQELFKLLNKNSYLAKRKDFTSTALHWACKHGNVDVVKLLCGTEGVHVNAKSGYTPLHLAAMQGHEEIIEILVAVYGADSNLRDYNGKKPKQYLRNSASSRCHQLLQARRHSMVQGASIPGSFKRQGSYSTKIRSAGHFGIHASAAMRTSWAASGGAPQSRSVSPSPSSSPNTTRKGSMRDEELMPPPQDVPTRRRRNKRSGSKDKIRELQGLEKTESEPCLSQRATSVPPDVSDQDLNRADSDPTISLQRPAQGIPQSVSYTSVV